MDDTICAISTPLGNAGIGIVRLSGKDAISIAKKIFRPKINKDLDKVKSHTLHLGIIYDNDNNKIDEVLVSIMHAPNTYTKEDIVEINCHSGILVLQKILELLLENGARLAKPGEFTKRAFLNGRIDLTQAEAVLNIVKAKTDRALKLATSQLTGALSKEISIIYEDLLSLLSHIEVVFDYPEEDIEELPRDVIKNRINKIINRIDNLLKNYQYGKIIKEGLITCIVGKPNVGKSSLLNALLKEERVIVTDIPGTTRDVIEEVVNLDGIPLRIRDTAGIRSKTEDKIEKIGIEYTTLSIEIAEFIILMLDYSSQLDSEDLEIIDKVKDKKKVAVINKIDLEKKLEEDKLKELLDTTPIVKTSIIKNVGIDELKQTIIDMFIKGEIYSDDEILLTNIRHKEALEKVRKILIEIIENIEKSIPTDLLSIDLRCALDYLGEITGRCVTDELLDKIFEEFCVGK